MKKAVSALLLFFLWQSFGFCAQAVQTTQTLRSAQPVRMAPAPQPAKKAYFYYKNGKKYQLKQNTKKIRLYKVNPSGAKQVDKIYVKELILENEAKQHPNFDRFYAKVAFRGYKSKQTAVLETKCIGNEPQVTWNGGMVKSDGKNYNYERQEGLFSYGVFAGFEQYGSFLEAGLMRAGVENEFELNWGLIINPLTFRLLNAQVVPAVRFGGGFSYEKLAGKSPDSIFGSAALGTLIGSQNVKFELFWFYKAKFYEEIKTEYGTIGAKEIKLGLDAGFRYLF